MGAPRTILYTGKGGVGKTSVAAATARRCAAAGLRTVVLSTDPAHSLSDVLGQSLGAEPVAIGDRLWGQEVSAQDEMERNWAGVQDWLGDLLIARGVDRISAEELTVPPGMDELFSLLTIKRHHESGEYDAVIVDCAPTGETLRLLSFPDVARWWLDKVFPQQGRILDAARPFARAVLDVSLPGDEVFDDVQRLVRNLIAMNEILRDNEHVSMRLVMTPDRMVVDEARRTFTYLNLYGYLTDAVVVNRVFGAEVGDYFGAWRERQQEQLTAVRDAFAPVPVLQAPYFERGGRRRGDARPPRRRRSSPATPSRTPTRCTTLGLRAAGARAPTARRCAWSCPSPTRATSRSSASGSELDRARRRAQAHHAAAARAGRPRAHAAPRSRTAR